MERAWHSWGCGIAQAGNINKSPLPYVVDRAVSAIMVCKVPKAVCVDPKGRVTVEPVVSAPGIGLVGVWSSDLSRAQLEEDVS